MSIPVEISDVEKVGTIFMSPFWEKKMSLIASARQLVHYTSAENAIRILTDKKIMLRSTVCMNDYSEVQHGHTLIHRCFYENSGELFNAFIEAFEKIFPGAAKIAFDNYDRHFKEHAFRTFIACLSEHDEQSDDLGRLSMWRAYSHGSTGVAIVLNKTPFHALATHFFGFFASPVLYLREEQIKQYLRSIISRATEERAYLVKLGRDRVINSIFVMLMFSSICIKHYGFEEEREWRVIYLPALVNSPFMSQETVTIGGIPQIAYKLSLQDHPADGLVGIEIPKFIREIITGPTNFPFPIHEALADALGKAGVVNPHSILRPSTIPLRT